MIFEILGTGKRYSCFRESKVRLFKDLKKMFKSSIFSMNHFDQNFHFLFHCLLFSRNFWMELKRRTRWQIFIYSSTLALICVSVTRLRAMVSDRSDTYECGACIHTTCISHVSYREHPYLLFFHILDVSLNLFLSFVHDNTSIMYLWSVFGINSKGVFFSFFLYFMQIDRVP